jgi:hypothetical protein
VCSFAIISAYGQAKGFTGKWSTDAAIARARGGAAPAPEGARGGGGGAITVELKVDASNKVTGQVTEFGNALCGNPDTVLMIESGMIDGKMITFQVTRPNCPQGGQPAAPGGIGVTWTGTLSDDEQTITAGRAIAGGGRGGRGGGGGGGRGGGAPGAGGPGGGAPGGGGPGGGPGGAQAAGGGAPGAGGPPAGGGGQGAGPGGGGRGGAGGRGGGGQIILHRA